MYNPEAEGRRELWIIKQPIQHQSLLVISGRHGVFLPLPNDARSVEELACTLGTNGDQAVRYEFTGDMLPWPSGPEHLLDPPLAAVPPR